MKNFFIKEFEAILDDDRTITHETFTEVIEKSLEENNRSKLKLPSDMTFDLLDFCYPPIVQSGGKFDLKPSAMSNEDELHAGVVICCIGLKYKGYCVNLGRTFLIDPEKSSGKEKNYRFLLELQEHIFTSLIKDGVTCKDIYNKAVSYVEKKRPDLKEYFVKNIGFGIGLEFRDSNYVLSGKNSREIKSGMVLNVSIGFQGLEAAGVTDEKSKTYALLLMDTVRVTPEGCSVITEATKEVTDISYEFKEPDGDEENADDSSVRKEATSSAPPVKKTAVISSKLRAEEKVETRKSHSFVL